MNKILKYSAFSVLLAVMAGCAEDNIIPDVGTLPDETAMNIVGGRLFSDRSLLDSLKINLYEGDTPRPEKISYALTKPAASAVTLKAIVDPTLVDAYNEEYNTEFATFPADNVSFGNGGTLTIAVGEQTSTPVDVSISTDGLEPKVESDTTYLLPVTVAEAAAKVEIRTDKQILYYQVRIQKENTTCDNPNNTKMDIPPLLPDLISVVYVNTSTYQPLIAGVYGVMTTPDGKQQPQNFYSLAHIVNLKTATVDCDASGGRAMFNLSPDLSYVLEHQNKYIRPLKNKKTPERKICICIENGGKGVGFCNMSDAQIADFTAQVKEVITRYNLDGVNLWDDDSKYGKAGMPEMNTTSYPKLIKALREALPGKLLTLVDKGDATEYFYDKVKCGGIEVGRNIDYAWHGYCSPTEDIQLINPNMDGSTGEYSNYARKPIAGLAKERYGSVTIPLYKQEDSKHRNNGTKVMEQWKAKGNKKSNILVFGNDYIGPEYAGYEGFWHNEQGYVPTIDNNGVRQFMNDGDSWDFATNRELYGIIFYSAKYLDLNLRIGPGNNHYRKDW